jgi:hypothetical protein
MVRLSLPTSVLRSPHGEIIIAISSHFTKILQLPISSNFLVCNRSIYFVGLNTICFKSTSRLYKGSSFKLSMYGLGFRYLVKSGLLTFKMACSHSIIIPPTINILVVASRDSIVVSSPQHTTSLLYSFMCTKARVVGDYSFKGISLLSVTNKKVIKNNS